MTRMNNPLEPAYRAAWYYFWWNGRSERIHPGQCLQLLQPFLTDKGGCWVWITAANPGSARCDVQKNRWRNLILQQCILSIKSPFGPAWSGSRQNDWPVEAGYWVITDHLEPVFKLGRRFGQRAVLLGGRDRPAELYWLNPSKS